MYRIAITLSAALLSGLLAAQTITITFEGTLNGTPWPLDSIRIMNLDQGGDTMLYTPDTVLVLGSTGLMETSTGGPDLQVSPNPFGTRTELRVNSKRPEDMLLTVHDLAGREVAALRLPGGPGQHQVSFLSALPGVHLLSAVQGGVRRTVRLAAVEGEGDYSLEYKTTISGQPKAGGMFLWSPGDALRYIGYASDTIGVLSGSLDAAPSMTVTEMIQFGRGLVCPGSPTVTDIDGNTYPTVQIGNQCWMAENLRTEHYSNGSAIAHVTDIITTWRQSLSGAWCNYDNDPQLDTIYGKIYNWYAADDPAGLCSQGWHVPTDADWQQMEAALGMPIVELGWNGIRGAAQNVGGQLKDTTLWVTPNIGATNTSGFSGLPGGLIGQLGADFLFLNLGVMSSWWSSSQSSGNSAWRRGLDRIHEGVVRGHGYKAYGSYVRCVKD